MSYSIALPQNGDQRIEALRSLVKVFAGSWLMALSAQWIIPLQPVPITLQTLMAMLLGVFLGPRQAAYSVLLYLIQIGVGLPVAAGAIANPAVLVGPKVGYLLGMVFQAYCVGWYTQNYQKLSKLETLVSYFMISLVQLSMGAIVLGSFLGAKVALFAGFVPFIAIEMMKSAIAMKFCKIKS